MAWTGQASSHMPQKMQRSMLISYVAAWRLHYQNPVGIVLAAALVSVVLALLYRGRYHAYEVAVGSVANAGNYALGTVQAVGAALFTHYLYPFELTSLLLLVAAVGAIYLSRGE